MTLDVILRKGVALLWSWSMGVLSEGPLVHPGQRNVLDFMLYMPSQHYAIQFPSSKLGCKTDCMLGLCWAPVVRLPDSHVYALWP